MRIGFIVNHPTQFEVPFYQFLKRNFPDDEFVVYYLKPQQNEHWDKELGKDIKWGFDLFAAYPHFFLPLENRLSTFQSFLEKDKHDLVIVNGYKNQYAGFSEICRTLRVKVALRSDTVLFNQHYYKILLRKLFLNSAYGKFDHFLVTGKVSKDYLLEMGISENKINIFSYCVDNDFFSKPRPLAVEKLKETFQIKNEKIILSVAKFMDRESPWDILKAFVSLDRRDLVLILVGDGMDREKLEKYALSYPKLKIIFPGYINYQDLPTYYQMSNIFVHPAKDEPWGVSVQEAIAGGCFVICSDKVGAAHDLIKLKKNGLTYSSGNYSALATQLVNGLTIDTRLLKETNQMILNSWNYHLMWKEVNHV